MADDVLELDDDLVDDLPGDELPADQPADEVPAEPVKDVVPSDLAVDPPVEQPVAKTIRDQFAELGLPIKADSDEAALKVAAETLLGVRQTFGSLTARNKQLEERLAALESTKPAETVTAAEKKRLWAKLDYDPLMEELVKWEEDANGRMVAVPAHAGVDPSIAKKVMDARREQTRRIQLLTSDDPLELLKDQLTELIDARADEVVSQRLGRASEGTVIEQIAASNTFAYEKDASGNILRDDFGNVVFSKMGRDYLQAVHEAQADGITDPRKQDAWAKRAIGYTGATQAAPPAETDADRKEKLLRSQRGAATHGGNRGAAAKAAPGKKAVVDTALSLADLLNQNMERDGVTDDQII
jgi:hypothetical protein